MKVKNYKIFLNNIQFVVTGVGVQLPNVGKEHTPSKFKKTRIKEL